MSEDNRLFGWSLFSKAREDQPKLKTISAEPNDGSIVVTKNGNNDVVGDAYSWSLSMELDPLIVSETSLITKYRDMSLVPEIDKAIDIIINEVVTSPTEDKDVVEINLDRLEYSDSVKNKIINEFNYVLRLLDFNNDCYEIVRRWYVDGRLHYQVVVDKEEFKNKGISKLVYLDPRKIKKVRVVNRVKDTRTGVDLYSEDPKETYYMFSESGFTNSTPGAMPDTTISSATVKIAADAVVQTNSGILDPTNSVVLSYLHKAIRPLNQLKSLEDASMIYKISRAPERRIFYIDVGNLPPAKAEQVLQRQMNQYRSKMIYDVQTGSVRSDPKQLTMIEDYWLPRRSDGKATEITTLPAGQLSGDTEEMQYFLNKLYNALNVPITRMDSSTGFTLGRTTEITRDEVALTKFVDRLRRKFSTLFLDLLQRQLALKNILNDVEFENIRQDISFNFESDNHFNEMLALEVLDSRLNILDRILNYIPGGQFTPMFSKNWVYNNVLFFTEQEIETMQKEIQGEMGDVLKQQEQQAEHEANLNAIVQPPEQQDPQQPRGEGGPRVSRVIHSNNAKTSTPRKNINNSNQTKE